jgi:hypothetical protein
MQTIEPGKNPSEASPESNVVKKRVGIITMFHNSINYGGVLQAYALHATIQNLGFECDVIRYSANKYESEQMPTITIIKRELVRGGFTLEHIGRIHTFFTQTTKNIFYRIFKTLGLKIYLEPRLSLRKGAFAKFNNTHIKSTKPYDDETISECVRNYDIFICGSDQIWKPTIFTPTYALGFVPDTKLKIAYAPSIAINSLTSSEIEYMQPLVNRLDAISVREERGKELLEMVTNKEVHWVLDPTLLLGYEEWKKIVSPYPIKKPYIFCYILGNSKKIKQFVLHTAEQLGMPIVTTPFVGGNFISFRNGDIRVYDAGPGEFLDLIQNADYVITNSFHATVFSIIFRKKFLVLKRSVEDNSSSTTSRVQSLLKICRLENRFIKDIGSFDPANLTNEIDYDSVFVHLNNKRDESLNFLIQALSKW